MNTGSYIVDIELGKSNNPQFIEVKSERYFQNSSEILKDEMFRHINE